MNFLRKCRSRKCLLAGLGVFAVLAGLAMLHPYPRQALFGPTIRGKPQCVWEAEIRRSVLGELSLFEKSIGWFGVHQQSMTPQDLFDDAEMLPLVTQMLDDPEYRMRHYGIGLFTMFPALQDRSALPALRKHLESNDLECRLPAARAVWVIDRDKTVFPVMLKPLDDPEPGIRALAMSHVAMMSADAPELYPDIIARVKDPNHRVRAPIMYAMVNFGKKGVPILIEGLNDPSAEVRLAAAIAADNMGAADDKGAAVKDALPALEARLRDVDPDVRTLAATALQRIDPERYKHVKGLQK